jgi:hypothetical protein
MLSKSVRFAMFVLGALAILGLTAGVTQAANQLLTGGDANTHYAAAQLGTVKDLSLKARASAALGVNLKTRQAKATAGYLEMAEPTLVEKIEFNGVVTAVEMGMWTIGNFQVQVTADTKVKGDPVLGETVEVEAFVQENGTLAAHEIVIERVIFVPVDNAHDVSDDKDDGQSDSGDDNADHDDDEDDDHNDSGEGEEEEEECTEEGGGEHGSKP